MVIRGRSSRIRRLMGCAAALAAQLIPLAASGAPDGQTVKLKVNSTLGYDSNVFRLPSGVPARAFTGSDQRSDFVTSVSAGASVDWTQGRQRVLLDGNVTDNRYANFDFLDHVASDVRALYNWELGDAWTGDIGYSASKSLTSFGDFRAPVKNIQKLQRTGGTAYYRVLPRWRLKAGASKLEFTNNTALRKVNDRDETAYEGGFQYESPDSNTIGLQARRTNGDFPNVSVVSGATVDSSFEQTDVEATLNWKLTGASRLSGFVGHSKRTHPVLSVRDFSGPSARLVYDWQPAGKMTYSVSLRREIGAYTDVDTSYVLTKGVAASATWTPTAKIAATARIERRIREFLGDRGLLPPGEVPREDTTDTASLGITYAATRKIDLSLTLAHEERSANRPLLDYRVTSVFATAQIVF